MAFHEFRHIQLHGGIFTAEHEFGKRLGKLGFAVATLIASALLGKRARRNEMKDSAYECGMLPIGEGQSRFSVKFYLVAMLFVLFDIEVVFLVPWAVVFKEAVASGATQFFYGMLGFVGVLFLAYLYALNKGALNWKES